MLIKRGRRFRECEIETDFLFKDVFRCAAFFSLDLVLEKHVRIQEAAGYLESTRLREPK